MVKTRYFYSLFLLNCLMNVIIFVPRTLVNARFQGALMSIVAASIIAPLFVYAFARLIRRFPRQGLPEILAGALPRPLAGALVFAFSLLWLLAGMVTLLSFVDITQRFISPDTGTYMVMAGFLVLVCLCCRLDPLSILYALETLLVVTLPIILYSLFKALSNPYFEWNAVLQMLTYAWHAPDFRCLSGTTYLFSGYVNLVIFNRVFKSFKPSHFWMFGVFGLLCLLLTYLIPFGFFGTEAVGHQVYTWFSTADSIRISSFLIERMVFIFYFAYLTLSLTSCIVHWHVALSMMTSLLPKRLISRPKRRVWAEAGILFLFSMIGLNLMRLNQYEVSRLGLWFLECRWYGEMALLALLFYCFRRAGRASS
ncbi:GerAB/ArcD/ProY family transporter [Paenibacillus glufosinatiresistens]|uniref:GerAB/ArcD/ProY family transporter n=1 Tax=Paenibacillus glufosinatiresistens TaxID=3070657 RepID=UPI00286D9195|nr:GerAB/ArcD/ProY family transporter [Paenibacillus sp. YX.27]